MKAHFLTLIILVFLGLSTANCQEKVWTQSDRQKLIDNFKRTQAEINQETSKLSEKEWSFKESSDKWSIAEVVEHLNMWQLVTLENVRYAIYLGENPSRAKACASDSVNTSFIYEENPHKSPDFTIPTGLIADVNNLKIFNIKCNEIIEGIEKNDANFRNIIREGKTGQNRDLAQMYIIQYGHVDRHLRQIRRIKSSNNFPK